MHINHHIAKAVDRIKKAGVKPPFSKLNKKDRVEVTCQRNFVTVTILKGPNRTVYTGTAKVCPGDEHDDDIGIAIATKRALLSRNDKDMEFELKKMDAAKKQTKVEVPYKMFEDMVSVIRAHAYGKHFDRNDAVRLHHCACNIGNDHNKKFAKKYHKGAYVDG